MKLLDKISEKNLSAIVSRWTGNDASGYINSSRVNISTTRDVILHWRKSKKHDPIFVGCYRLYPVNLIKAGLCRNEGGKVRIILHHVRGRIILSLRREDEGALELTRAL